ncbi:hypothetical protein CC86DRAFT_409773 [Ophiobolus disseminans]|uniref:CFEM domain-containing protein n=1 Tax=Ophiobolus disseminans TaxID=1469910 RepID=A0A6A6ZPI9_9PLEO|nr:hypothetical protein CC86DRAFT_409773 [Ophiobolus disseminans]
MKFSLIGATLVVFVAGQIPTAFPECSVACLASSVAKVGCALSDVICQCSNAFAISADTAGCLTGSCGAAELGIFSAVAVRLCEKNGFSLDDVPELKARTDKALHENGHEDAEEEEGEQEEDGQQQNVIYSTPPSNSETTETDTRYPSPVPIVHPTDPCATVTLTVTSTVQVTSKVRTRPPRSTLTLTSTVEVTSTLGTTSIYSTPTLEATSIYSNPTIETTSVYGTPTLETTSIHSTPTLETTSIPSTLTLETTSTYSTLTLETTSIYSTPTLNSTSQSPYWPTGTGSQTPITTFTTGTGGYKPTSAPPPYTAAAIAMRVPGAVAGVVGLAAMVL